MKKIFPATLFVALYLLDYVLSMPLEKTLFQGAPKQFRVEGNNVTYNINVTLIDTRTVYRFQHMYTFYIPNIEVLCECTCRGEFARCSDSTDNEHKACALLKNETTRCTIYNTEGEDPRLCPKRYYACCRVYFSAYMLLGRYVAFCLKYHKTLYTLNILVTDSHENTKELELQVSADMEKIVMAPDIILEFPLITRGHYLQDGWYFTSENNLDLLSYPKINERFGNDMNRIGWFQQESDGEFARVSRSDLKSKLKVSLKKCEGTSPNYTWSLNATNFHRKGTLFFPVDVQRAIELHKNISSISIDLSKGTVIARGKVSPSIKSRMLGAYYSKRKSSFMFTSSIDGTNHLDLKFLRGNGNFNVNISNKYWLEIKTYHISEHDDFTNPIHIDNYEPPFWICVSKDQEKLCQWVDILLDDGDVKSTLHAPNTTATGNDSGYEQTRVTWLVGILLWVFGFITGCFVMWFFQQRKQQLWSLFTWKNCRRRSSFPRNPNDSAPGDQTETPFLDNPESQNSNEPARENNPLDNPRRNGESVPDQATSACHFSSPHPQRSQGVRRPSRTHRRRR